MGWGEAMNTNLLRVAFWVWLAGIGVSRLNFFVLMNRVYEPTFGALRAHQIGMTTRIVYIAVRYVPADVRGQVRQPRSHRRGPVLVGPHAHFRMGQEPAHAAAGP